MLPFRAKIDFGQIKKVLFIRKDNLGDLLLSLPLATLLKQQYPHLRIDFMLPAYTAALAKLSADVDQVFILPADLSVSTPDYQVTLELIKQQKYDMAVIIHTKYVLAKIVFDAQIPLRLGRTERIYALYFNHWIFQTRKHQRKHELDYNLELIKSFVPLPGREAIPFNFKLSPAAAVKVEQFLQNHHVSNFTIIHPGSNGSAMDLPLATYAGLIDSYPFPGSVMITGTAKESPLYHYLATNCRKPLIDATGQFSIEELMCLIQRCDLLVSNSTGPLHIARVFNKKLLGFYTTFKPAHPRRWGPYLLEQTHTLIPANEDYQVLQNDTEYCRNNMAQISIADIAQKLDAILAQH